MLMSENIKTSRALGPWILAFAAVAGITIGACKKMPSEGAGENVTMDVKNACNDYCAQAKLCNEDLNEQNCRNTCSDTVTDCQADEQDPAINQLRACSTEACEDFAGCTIQAGAQCVFGI
jgi:hypothetical protein